MIAPSNGRVVWFTPGPDFLGIWRDKSQKLTAHIVHVHRPNMINLAVFDSDGNLWPEPAVRLLQDGETPPAEGRFAEWMPYQKGQAAKTEQLERKIGENT